MKINFTFCTLDLTLLKGEESLHRPEGFQKVEAPIFQDNRQMVVRLSAVRTGRLYPAGHISGTHFCYILSRPQGNRAAGRIMAMNNSNDTIGNRTRLPLLE